MVIKLVIFTIIIKSNLERVEKYFDEYISLVYSLLKTI